MEKDLFNNKDIPMITVEMAADSILKGSGNKLLDEIYSQIREAEEISEEVGLNTARTLLCIVIISGAEAKASVAPRQVTMYPTIAPHLLVKSVKDALDRIASSIKESEKAIIDYRMNEKHSIVEHVKEYINTHYEHQIFMTDIADFACLSPNYLGRIFKEYTKESITDYIHRLRIARAKVLLRETNERVSQIAFSIGFRDSNYFSTIFKRFVGISPKEYREKNTKRSQPDIGEL